MFCLFSLNWPAIRSSAIALQRQGFGGHHPSFREDAERRMFCLFSLNWPAIRSSAIALLRQGFGGHHPSFREDAERRMVEAAGIEPASLTNIPAATTCLVRKRFSAGR